VHISQLKLRSEKFDNNNNNNNNNNKSVGPQSYATKINGSRNSFVNSCTHGKIHVAGRE